MDKNPLYYNELNDKRIKLAVQEQLKYRGYMISEKKPDMILHYHIVVDDQSIVTTDPHGEFYSPDWVHLRTNIQQYREGSLIIDVMESKNNNLIWRGWAASPIDRIYTSAQIDGLIKKAITKIFQKFPKNAQ